MEYSVFLMYCFDFVQLLELTENYTPEVSDYKVNCIEFQNIYVSPPIESYHQRIALSLIGIQPVLTDAVG